MGKYKDVDFGNMSWSYVYSKYYACEYNGEMTISKAYEWLKALPQYEGAEDI